MASAYNHIILPLAPERDVRTQLRWGAADFRARFGREPEGLWFPETAVDEARAAPSPPRRACASPCWPPPRRRGSGPSGPTSRGRSCDGEPVDARRTYRWCHPARPTCWIDIVFYDGALSADLAFGEAWKSAAALVERASAPRRPTAGSVCAATDGETFGHHHRFAERALAYALPVEAPRAGVDVVTVAGALRAIPPDMQVQVPPSSWSCAHGLERWRSDCGCSTGGQPGATQAWRAPVRAALDVVRSAVDEVFERRGATVLVDPWSARDAYGEVVVGTASVEAFAAAHVTGGGADEAALVEALTLLEAERHALLMYTSCGWFFWDLAGLETVQVLRYAARALDLLEELGEEAPRDAVLEVLAGATSNVAAEGTGADVWRRRVEPARVDATRVAAALALAELLDLPRPGRHPVGSGVGGPGPGGRLRGGDLRAHRGLPGERVGVLRHGDPGPPPHPPAHDPGVGRHRARGPRGDRGRCGPPTRRATPRCSRGSSRASPPGRRPRRCCGASSTASAPPPSASRRRCPPPAAAPTAAGRARLTPCLQEVLVEAVERALAGGGDEATRAGPRRARRRPRGGGRPRHHPVHGPGARRARCGGGATTCRRWGPGSAWPSTAWASPSRSGDPSPGPRPGSSWSARSRRRARRSAGAQSIGAASSSMRSALEPDDPQQVVDLVGLALLRQRRERPAEAEGEDEPVVEAGDDVLGAGQLAEPLVGPEADAAALGHRVAEAERHDVEPPVVGDAADLGQDLRVAHVPVQR